LKALSAVSAGFVLALGLIVAKTALAEPRVALVIGNSAYKDDLPALPNPANDAKLMAKTLKGVGFDVVEAEDASQDEMKKAIAEFSDKLAAAGPEGTGLFFYAGHGLQVAGENYLIPVDAKIKSERDVDLVSISANTVLKQMDFAGSAVNIIILDACRNNPLGDGARSISRGLAKIETAPRGSFIAYSTAPGSTAADGDGANSPYTTALAETITEPGLSISDVFQEVRTKVLASTGNVQTPWDSSSLTGRFYFKAPDSVAAAAPATGPAPVSGVDELTVEKTFWDSVKDSTDADDFQAYLAKYPNGAYVDVANFKLDQLKGGTQVARADTANKTAAPTQDANDASKVATPSGTAFVAQNQTVYAKGGGQVRSAPEGGADLMTKLQNNTEVTATGVSTDGKWWRVAMADGRTGYMHKSVVSERPAQVASAAPAQPASTETRTVEADPSAFQTMGAPAQAPVPQGNDVATQLFQGLANSAAQKLGLPGVNIPQQQASQEAAGLSYVPINETVKVRAGAAIFDQPGGRQIVQVTKNTQLLASQRSSDGRWYGVSLPNGQTGYIARQSLGK